MSQFKRGSFESKRHSFVRQSLRRASFRWPARNAAMKKARKARAQYECAMCKNLFGPKEVALDHIDPVVDPNDGFVSWDSYIVKLLCPEDGYQVLCHTCHDAKTAVERNIRNDKDVDNS